MLGTWLRMQTFTPMLPGGSTLPRTRGINRVSAPIFFTSVEDHLFTEGDLLETRRINEGGEMKVRVALNPLPAISGDESLARIPISSIQSRRSNTTDIWLTCVQATSKSSRGNPCAFTIIGLMPGVPCTHGCRMSDRYP